MEKYNIPENNSLDSMEGVENLNQNEENSMEISPEVEKMVMEKVKDIFEDGTAYHTSLRKVMNLQPNHRKINDKDIKDYFEEEPSIENGIEKLLKHGVMGTFVDEKLNRVLPEDSKEYRNSIRNTNKKLEEPIGPNASGYGKVFFSIQGRVNPKNIAGWDSYKEPSEEPKALKEWEGSTSITFIFDAPDEEVFILDKDSKGELFRNKKLKLGQYSVSHFRGASIADDVINDLLDKYPGIKPSDQRIKEEMGKEGRLKNKYSQYFNSDGNTVGGGEGFTLPFRISPRKYQGVIIGTGNSKVLYEDIVKDDEFDISSSELFKRYSEFDKKLSNNDKDAVKIHLENIKKKVVKMMLQVNEKKPERIIPVYDNSGNLLWPQKISHEEIVKMKEETK